MAGSGQGKGSDHGKAVFTDNDIQKPNWKGTNLKPLDKCLIPFRLAIALQEDGWYVRQDVIWNKPNPMPESMNSPRWVKHWIKVKRKAGEYWASNSEHEATQWQACPGCPVCLPNDGLVLRKGSWRPTESHEYIFMLTKTDDYYCDGEAARETSTERASGNKERKYRKDYGGPEGNRGHQGFSVPFEPNGTGRNLRSVWTFPTHGYPGAHFATYPEQLPELCIKASTPEYGVCAECGKPWARVIESKDPPEDCFTKTGNPDDGLVAGHRKDGVFKGSGQKMQNWIDEHPNKTLGWRKTCKCKTNNVVPATVLDNFAGSGTTLKVAAELGRRAVGYELSKKYSELIVDRNKQGVLG
jgi:DNA modification methylase